jgi:hypothetical protein
MVLAWAIGAVPIELAAVTFRAAAAATAMPSAGEPADITGRVPAAAAAAAQPVLDLEEEEALAAVAGAAVVAGGAGKWLIEAEIPGARI